MPILIIHSAFFSLALDSIHKPLHSDNIVDFSFIDKKQQHPDGKATQSSIKSENVQLVNETRWIEGFVNVKANFKILHSISNYKLKVTHRHHTTQKWLRLDEMEKDIFFWRKIYSMNLTIITFNHLRLCVYSLPTKHIAWVLHLTECEEPLIKCVVRICIYEWNACVYLWQMGFRNDIFRCNMSPITRK